MFVLPPLSLTARNHRQTVKNQWHQISVFWNLNAAILGVTKAWKYKFGKKETGTGKQQTPWLSVIGLGTCQLGKHAPKHSLWKNIFTLFLDMIWDFHFFSFTSIYWLLGKAEGTWGLISSLSHVGCWRQEMVISMCGGRTAPLPLQFPLKI